MKFRFLLLLSVLFVSTIIGCKKSPTNENGNESGETLETPLHFEEDLSFTRILKQLYYRNNGDSVLKVYDYDGNKKTLYELYRNGVLQTQWDGFVYDGLTCVYTITNSASQVEAYTEYLDDSYSRPFMEKREQVMKLLVGCINNMMVRNALEAKGTLMRHLHKKQRILYGMI